MTGKLLCKECQWRGSDAEVLRAPNPWDPTEIIIGCPKCNTLASFVLICDETDCPLAASCGTPVPDGGYRRTCFEHRPTP